MSPKDASWGGRLAWRGSNPPPPRTPQNPVPAARQGSPSPTPGGCRIGPALPKCRPALALSRQGEETKAAKGTMAGGLAAAPRAGREPRVLPTGIPGGTCLLPGAAGLSADTGFPADRPRQVCSPIPRAGGDAALPGRGLRGQRQPRRESLGRASWYIPGAGAEGLGAPRPGAPGMGTYRGSLATSRDSLPPRPRPGAPLGSGRLRTCTARVCSASRGGEAVEATARYL